MDNHSTSPSSLFDPDDEGYSEKKTAKILKVKVRTLATWRSLGKGPRYRKNGRQIEYTPRFIKEYQQSCTRTPEPASVRRQRSAIMNESRNADSRPMHPPSRGGSRHL